ncbi:MAG: hypothetical protein Q4F69_11180 [Bacteroidia bacterium]|nr:hypothetical protein [Bacteroidia bacterium]
MKKYYKIKLLPVCNTDLNTKAKRMIYEALTVYNRRLILADEEELAGFFEKIIEEISIRKDSFRKWPVLSVNRIRYDKDSIHMDCDLERYLDTEELRPVSLDDSNPFQLSIDFKQEA